MALRRAVADLGDTRGIRVVDELDVASEALFEELLGLEVDPLLRHVGGREGATLLHDRGEGDAEGNLLVDATELVEHLVHGGEDVIRRRPLRGVDADAVAQQLSALQIYDAGLDAGPPDVDTDSTIHAL